MEDESLLTATQLLANEQQVVQRRHGDAEKKERIEYNRQIRWGWATFALTGAGFLLFRLNNPAWVQPLAFLSFFSAAAATGIWLVKRRRAERLRELLRSLELEMDLLRFRVSAREHRAEKLLRQNQYELHRYYSQVLNQGAWVFGVGILCLLGGLAIVAYTLGLLAKPDTSENASTLAIALVGSIGAVLTNFVAAIFLRMHAGIATNLSMFHERLVGSHSMFFANVLAARLPEVDQNRTLEQLALAMARDVRKGTTVEAEARQR
jgi:hypothetical protein